MQLKKNHKPKLDGNKSTLVIQDCCELCIIFNFYDHGEHTFVIWFALYKGYTSNITNLPARNRWIDQEENSTHIITL